MKNWIVLLIAAFLFFSGCQKDETILPLDEMALVAVDQNTASIGEEIFLQMNESVTVMPAGFTITFNNVSEDSRCPIGVDCVWEGRAVIGLTIENRDASYEVLLETPNSQQTHGPAVNLFGRTIKLILVAPHPTTNHPITNKEYRITLLVNELEHIIDDD